MDATRYLPSDMVAWRTIVNNVILLTSETIENQATYRVTVYPLDVNEPGAMSASVSIGYFLKDNIGHTYKVISVGSGTIDVSDDFRCGAGPQSGRCGMVYKSVWKGRAPYLAPVYYRHLDKVAIDYSRQLELDILWSNDPNAKKVTFTNTATPGLVNYQSLYAWDYGELPKIELFTMDSSNVYWSRQEKPIFTFVDGLIDSITFDLSDLYTGYITISK